MKSLQYTGFNTFAEIVTDMAKKMLFLRVVQGGQERPERQEAAIQMQRLRPPVSRRFTARQVPSHLGLR